MNINIKRIDLKPYCLLLEAKDQSFFLSFEGAEELNGWGKDLLDRARTGVFATERGRAFLTTSYARAVHLVAMSGGPGAAPSHSGHGPMQLPQSIPQRLPHIQVEPCVRLLEGQSF